MTGSDVRPRLAPAPSRRAKPTAQEPNEAIESRPRTAIAFHSQNRPPRRSDRKTVRLVGPTHRIRL